MGIRNFKNVLNRYYAKHVGGDKRPAFFDIAQAYPSLDKVTEKFPQIKNEFEEIYNKITNMPRYHEIDPGETEISNTTDKNWNVFMLYLLGHKPEKNRAMCPETCKVLETIPGMVQAFFSILEPGKCVPLHKGPYLGYLRYHLGIHVPKQNPPSITVKGKEYVWQEGKAVLFDDSYPHEVKNQAKDYRAVLIIDVIRPMPLLPHIINKFAAAFVAKHTYGKDVMRRMQDHAAMNEVTTAS